MIKFIHFDTREGVYPGKYRIRPFRGMSIGYEYSVWDGVLIIKASAAYCSPNDVFTRKHSRLEITGRLKSDKKSYRVKEFNVSSSMPNSREEWLKLEEAIISRFV